MNAVAKTLLLFLSAFWMVDAFVVSPSRHHPHKALFAVEEDKVEEEKAVSMVTGEELELLLADMDQPLVLDAYATWW